MLVYRSTVAAGTLACALLVGCSDPDLPTDLRTSGPPNVTTVTVLTDLKTAVDPSPPRIPRLIESATYCRVGDEKRPSLVGLPGRATTQVCPENLSAASETQGTAEGAPPNWFVRVVFDKLLDPSVEELTPVLDAMGNPTTVMMGTLINTQPVTLKCNGADVPYNGYYVPNGNSVSWPLGPALFIQPLATAYATLPTGAGCEVAIKDMVHNKKGEPVPTDQRTYTFKIAPMKLRFSSPDPTDDGANDGSLALDPDVPVQFFWTASLKTTIAPADIKIFQAPNLNAGTGDGTADPAVCAGGGTAVPTTDIETAPDGTGAATTSLVMDLDTAADANTHAWLPKTTYRIEFATTAKASPKQGGADGTIPAGFKLCFHTTAPAPM
jgi:hypothetical protein